ncbi:DUF3830 family protein [Rudaea sp.]|uniref:DUF3830 family protein n=1 Tax=Rudaea sp. TaxID=2136325 RepID=UPI002ED36ED4
MNATVSIGTSTFRASIASPRASASWDALARLLPYAGTVLHARWSGEAIWSPLRTIWPAASLLPRENAVGEPRPGQILLYAGQDSEPELLLAYGQTRFASGFGPLLGNPVLTIVDRLDELASVGRSILENGAGTLRIELNSNS